MAGRFATALDCADISFLPDGILDQLPLPAQLGATRIGGIELDKPRIRAALSEALALATAPRGFTVADFTAKVQAMTGQASYTTRQAGCDIRRLRGKNLAERPGGSRCYLISPQAACTIAALLTLRDQIIGPILAGVRSPRLGRKPAVWTPVDRRYESLRIGMQQLFHDLGITTAASTTFCRSSRVKLLAAGLPRAWRVVAEYSATAAAMSRPPAINKGSSPTPPHDDA